MGPPVCQQWDPPACRAWGLSVTGSDRLHVNRCEGVRWMYREVSVIEVRELLRAWLLGVGLRRVAAQAGGDRKTARRYVDAAVAAGLDRDGGGAQLCEECIRGGEGARGPRRP